MITVWGLKNCDTCRKARAWLDAVGADVLLNRRGTTWRGLDATARARAEDPAAVAGLLAEHPALIKRPVFVGGDGTVVVGFGKTEQARVGALS